MSRTLCCFVIGALVLGLSPAASAQSGPRALTVTARMEADHLYYEIMGTGFAPGERVRVNVRNARAQARMVFRVETSVSGVWRVFVGRDGSGAFSPVPSGTWRIRARAGGVEAKTTFTAHGDEAISEWGGDHVLLRVFEIGATIEYDCGHGTIDVPFVVDGDGRFDVSGVHVFEHGGPVHNDEVPDAHPARYTGQVAGERMTLTLSVPDRGVSETFSLVRDAPGSIVRCY